MFAIRARRKVATERDFLDAVEKVVRQGTKFSSTSVYQSLEPVILLIPDQHVLLYRPLYQVYN